MLTISAIPDKLRMLCIQMLYKKMKYETSEQFEFLDFHDSIIDGTTISDDVISIEIEFANILPEHSENPYRTAKNIEPCRLQFVGVVRREVALYK